MKTHTAALRNIIYCTEPTGLPPVAPSLDGQLYIWDWENVDAGAPHRTAWAIVCRQGTLSPENPCQTIGLFKGGPGGPDPMGKEGQLEREAQSCAMCLRRPSLRFTPPRGWEPGHILSQGTKRGVYVRGVGVQEGF